MQDPRVEETLPQEVLTKMYAPAKDTAIPTITPEILEGYDGVLLGIPTRYGNFPAQWKTFVSSIVAGQRGSVRHIMRDPG